MFPDHGARAVGSRTRGLQPCRWPTSDALSLLRGWAAHHQRAWASGACVAQSDTRPTAGFGSGHDLGVLRGRPHQARGSVRGLLLSLSLLLHNAPPPPCSVTEKQNQEPGPVFIRSHGGPGRPDPGTSRTWEGPPGSEWRRQLGREKDKWDESSGTGFRETQRDRAISRGPRSVPGAVESEERPPSSSCGRVASNAELRGHG